MEEVCNRLLTNQNNNISEVSLCNYRIDICKVDLEKRQDQLSYEGLTLYECNGVAFHGNPHKDPRELGNVYTGLTNQQEQASTKQRLEQLAKCVGRDNVIFKTDLQIEKLLTKNKEETDKAWLDYQ